MAAQAQIFVAELPDSGEIMVKIVGRCTAPACCVLKEYLESLKSPVWRQLSFDMSETTAVDSTCIGYVLTLARGGGNQPAFHIRNPSAAVRNALCSLRVENMVDIRNRASGSKVSWHELTVPAAKVGPLGDLVIEAHENIIRADSRNAPAFEPVVKGFRQAREARAAAVTTPPEDA